MHTMPAEDNQDVDVDAYDMSAEEAAKVLGQHVQTVYNALRAGTFPARCWRLTSHGTWHIHRGDVLRMVGRRS